MGIIHNQRGLQARISSKTCIFRGKKYCSKCGKFGNFKSRSKYFGRKRRCRNCKQESNSDRFLQYTFCSEKEKWKTKTGYKFTTSESVSQETTLQNGHNVKSIEPSEERRLGMLSRFTRCISSCSNISKTSEISKICNRRNSLPIQSSLFRSDQLTQSVHKNSFSDNSTSKKNGVETVSIFGRLANTKSKKTCIDKKSRVCDQSSDFTRIHNKCSKVRTNPNSDNSLHRGSIRLETRTSVSNSRKIRKSKKVHFSTDTRANCSETLSENFRDNGVMLRTDTEQSSVHETNTNALITGMESHEDEFRLSSSLHTRVESSPVMVVVNDKHNERETFNTGTDVSDHSNRRVEKRVGRSSRQHDSSGVVDNGTKEITHKQSGVGSSILSSKTLSSNFEGQVCSSTIGQHNSLSVLEQTRGDTVHPTLSTDMESVELGNKQQDNAEGSPHNGGQKCFSGQTKSNQGEVHRMDIELGDSQSDIPSLGVPKYRSVCIGTESQMSNILCLESGSSSNSSGCPVNKLGRNVCIRISSPVTDSQGVTTCSKISVHNNSNSATLGEANLVPSDTGHVDRNSNSITQDGESINTGGGEVEDDSSQPRSVQNDCMANIDSKFKEKGFSKNTRKLLSASWRSGTQKDYKSKFRQFSSWCSERNIDPYQASLENCANFLASLYDKGLKYRTIGGYRSMLSSVLPAIDKVPVGQHPYIIRLLKGVFNSRPPERKLLPEWDLPLVLKMFKNPPFSPMKLCKFKYLTWKTAFLVAITTFRRCSDLQALKLGEGSVNIQAKGVTFMRHGLAKQDRANHDNSKIFVPSFPEDRELDPKRTLYEYLKRTEKLRDKENYHEFKLFLSTNKPNRPVTSQTISKWIVKIIKMAYKLAKKKIGKVKGHSTRSIGPSWALFKGASMKNVMDSADWSRSTTFTKFYLKDVNVNFLNL